MKRKKIIDEIEDLIKERDLQNHYLMNAFFNLLFWKNYSEGYVNVNDKHSILTKISEATDGDSLNTKKILPFVNKIRTQIGLKELTAELDGCLMEITPEVTKRLILKNL